MLKVNLVLSNYFQKYVDVNDRQKKSALTSVAILMVIVAGFIVLDCRYQAGFANLTLTTATPLYAEATTRTAVTKQKGWVVEPTGIILT